MMEGYSWQIHEDGEPGKGAKFTITTPKQNPNGKENYQTIEQKMETNLPYASHFKVNLHPKKVSLKTNFTDTQKCFSN
jgi:hypothetical protein